MAHCLTIRMRDVVSFLYKTQLAMVSFVYSSLVARSYMSIHIHVQVLLSIALCSTPFTKYTHTQFVYNSCLSVHNLVY